MATCHRIMTICHMPAIFLLTFMEARKGKENNCESHQCVVAHSDHYHSMIHLYFPFVSGVTQGRALSDVYDDAVGVPRGKEAQMGGARLKMGET